MTVLSKPNITLHIEKIPKCNSKTNLNQIKNETIIESFEGIHKTNSRYIFFILIILVTLIYLVK